MAIDNLIENSARTLYGNIDGYFSRFTDIRIFWVKGVNLQINSELFLNAIIRYKQTAETFGTLLTTDVYSYVCTYQQCKRHKHSWILMFGVRGWNLCSRLLSDLRVRQNIDTQHKHKFWLSYTTTLPITTSLNHMPNIILPTT